MADVWSTDAAAPALDEARLADVAAQALAALHAAGADAAQASVTRRRLTELQINHNHASLLRSTERHTLALAGLWGGRKATQELPTLLWHAGAPDAQRLAAAAAALRHDAAGAPRDEAHAFSAGQVAWHRRGPQRPDTGLLADAAQALLDFRATHTPTVMLEEAGARHHRVESCLATSGGSLLQVAQGWYEVDAFGFAAEPALAGAAPAISSFNAASGQGDTLDAARLPEAFGIGDMCRELARSTRTTSYAARFGGPGEAAVVLSPLAVSTLLGWLLDQIGDLALLAGTSPYRAAVGQVVASPLLTLDSRFDAPGLAPQSADGFVAAPLRVLDAGRLGALTPSLYGSRKLGLAHVPVAAGWQLAPGRTPLAELLAAVPRGALVGRLSMGRPAANGDFSGVIKNSFLIDGGTVGAALSETMISGNVAAMLRAVSAASAERRDTGLWCMPWLRVDGLHFS